MSLDSLNLRISEPPYYHREYENDLGKNKPQSKNVFDQCMRVTQVALPFLSLYKPIGQPLSFVLGTLRTISCISQLTSAIDKKEKFNISYALVQTTVAISSLACSVFAHRLGMLINTGHDLLINSNQLILALQNKNYPKALEISDQILNNTLYLGLFFTGASEILLASLTIQILLGVYQSSEDFKQGNYLEAGGHLLMACVRTQELQTQLNICKLKWSMQAFLLEIKIDRSNEGFVKNSIEGKTDSRENRVQQLESPLEAAHEKLLRITTKYGNNPEGMPAFHYAILKNDVSAVDLFLEYGASPFAIDNRGNNCIFYAAKAGSLPLVQKFISLGVDPGKFTTDTQSPLSVSIINGKNDVAKFLINYGVNLDWAIETCCGFGNSEILKLLIDKNAIIKSNEFENSNFEILINLFRWPFDIKDYNDNKGSVLWKEKMTCIEMLKNKGWLSFDINPRMYLDIFMNTFPEGVKYLLDHKFILPNQYIGNVHILTYACHHLFHLEVLNIFVSKNSDVNALSNNRNILFSFAGISGAVNRIDSYKEFLTILINRGVNINFRDMSGETALKFAQTKWMRDLLISFGATL